jgi:hypothetical protein
VTRTGHFIELYNRLADYLIEFTQETDRTPFYQLVEKAASRNRLVRQEAPRLKRYGDLRNLIVHGTNYPREMIAEPTDETLAQFGRIVQQITSPKRLESFLGQVRCFLPEDQLVNALRYMRERDYSQVVIRKNHELGLLSTEGVSRWLERQAEDDIISIREAHVKDALKFDIPYNSPRKLDRKIRWNAALK